MAGFKLIGSQTGNYWKIEDGKRIFYDKTGKKIDQNVFLEAENAFINKDGKIQKNPAEPPKTEGKTSKDTKSINIKTAENIINQLKKATDGWNDDDEIKSTIAQIKNPEVLKEVEKKLASMGYKSDDMYSSLEKFLYKELGDSSTFDNSFEYLEQTVQTWIQSGVLKGDEAINAQARLAARIIRDGGDGMGTDCDEIKRGIHLIKSPKQTGNIAQDESSAKAVLQKVEQIIKNAHGESLEEYLDGEMWDSEVKYLKGIMAQNSAIQDKTKQQAVADLIKEAVAGAGTNVEELKQALKGITSEKDRKAINAILVKYCENKGIKGQIQGQHALQAIMYDELDGFAGIGTNHEEIRKFNEMLISQGAYSNDEAVTLRAEQAALQILEGGMDNIKDALENINDKAVLKALNSLLTTKGYKNIDDYLEKAGKSQEDKDIANSILAKKNMLNNKQAAEVAARLLLNDDFDTQANGVRAITNSEVAKLVDEELKKSNTTLAKVMETFNKEKDEYKFKATLYNSSLGILNEYISNQYEENTDISDNLYVESEAAQSISEEDKVKYNAVIEKLEADLNKLKEDYQEALDVQGAVSAGVDYIAASFNLGTNRKDIEARISEEEESLRLYKLASEGKLSKIVDGKTIPVSFEEIFKERQSNTEYKTKEVDTVTKQAERMVAMNMAKDIISTSWSELNNGLKTKEENALTVAVYNGIEALSKLNPEITLEKMGLSFDGTNIVDASGNKLSIEKLTEIANSLKQDYSNISKEVFNKNISADANNDDVLETLNDGYDSQLESFKEEYKKAFGKEPTDEMLADYLTTVNTGVMVVNIGAAIGATILTAGYGSLAIFGAVGATSAGLNMLEHSTDANGLTRDELAQDMEQAIWDGALGSVGVKVGQITEKFAVNAEVLLKNKQFVQNTLGKVMNLNSHQANRISYWVTRVEAAGGEISSDALQALAQQYCMNGEIDEAGFVKSMLMSIGFNTVGHLKSGISSTPTKGTIKDLGNEIKTDLVTDVKQSQSLLEGKPLTAEALKAKAETAERSYDMQKVGETNVSEEFRQGISQVEDAVKFQLGNTIGEMLDANPWFGQFKDQLKGLEDYIIVSLDDATKTARGSHNVSKKTGRQIALNIDALKNNEEAFVNTLMHEAEHARQHKQYTTLQFKKDKTAEDLKYIEAYKAMDKANKARQEFYKAHSKEINQFVDDIQGKSPEEIIEIISKYDNSQQEICQKYMKLYNEYKNSALEVEAREAGIEAVKTYNKNNEVTNGQEDRGSNPVREGDTAGDSDRSVGSDTRNESVEQGPKGTDERQETKVETDAPVKTDATSNPEIVTPARAEGSIEGGKIFFNGQEIDIPKTADEAKAFADSKGDNVTIYTYDDGRIDLEFRNEHGNIITEINYDNNGDFNSTSELFYDENNTIKNRNTKYYNPDGKVRSSDEWTYGDNYITESRTTKYYDSDEKVALLEEWGFDENQNYATKANKTYYDANGEVNHIEEFAYDGNDGHATSIIYKNANGTPTKYEVFENGEWVEKPVSEITAPKVDDAAGEQPIGTQNNQDVDNVDLDVDNSTANNSTNRPISNRPLYDNSLSGKIYDKLDFTLGNIKQAIANITDTQSYKKAIEQIKKLKNKGEREELLRQAKEKMANLMKSTKNHLRIGHAKTKTTTDANGNQVKIEYKNKFGKARTETVTTPDGNVLSIKEYDGKNRLKHSKEFTDQYNLTTEYDKGMPITAVKEIKDSNSEVISEEKFVYNQTLKTFVSDKPQAVGFLNGEFTQDFYDINNNVVLSRTGDEGNYQYYAPQKGTDLWDKIDDPFAKPVEDTHVSTKTKKDGTTIKTTKYGDDKKVVTIDKDNQVTRTELYHKGKQVSAEYIDKNGNMVYETYADGKLVKETGITKNGNKYQIRYAGKKITYEYTKPGETKPYQISTWNKTWYGNEKVNTKVYSDDGEILKKVINYNSKGNLSNIDHYADDGVQIKRHEEYYGDDSIAIINDNGEPSQLITYNANKDGHWDVKDIYTYNSASKQFELKDVDGKVISTATYDDKLHKLTVAEGDKKPKVYENKPESSHKVRNSLIGTAAVAGIAGAGYGVYESINSENSVNDATKADLTEVTEEETQPETSEETEPEVTEETQPETSEETEPEVTEETQPETSEETEPEVTEETQPETSEETEPEKKKESTPTNPAETTPKTKPVVTPTNPVETTPETKPVVTPTNPVETTPETKPVVTPTNPVETTPDVKPVDVTPQEEKTRVKPTIKESDLVDGKDSETGKKREITPIERMEITRQIEQAKNEEDLKLIQKEMRSFKKFEGRRNLRRALKAKRKMFKNPESERRQEKYEKRMDKIENSKVFQEDLIKTQYDYVEPEEKRFDDLDNPFLA